MCNVPTPRFSSRDICLPQANNGPSEMGDGSGRLQCWCYVVGKLCRLTGSSHCLTDTTALVASATGKLELVFLVICNQHSKSPGCWNGRKGIKEDFFSPCCTSCVCYAKVYVGTNHISQPQWWEAILPGSLWRPDLIRVKIIAWYPCTTSACLSWQFFILPEKVFCFCCHLCPSPHTSFLPQTRALSPAHGSSCDYTRQQYQVRQKKLEKEKDASGIQSEAIDLACQTWAGVNSRCELNDNENLILHHLLKYTERCPNNCCQWMISGDRCAYIHTHKYTGNSTVSRKKLSNFLSYQIIFKIHSNVWGGMNFTLSPSPSCYLHFFFQWLWRSARAQYWCRVWGTFISSPKRSLEVLKMLLLVQFISSGIIINSNCKSKWNQIPLFIN